MPVSETLRRLTFLPLVLLLLALPGLALADDHDEEEDEAEEARMEIVHSIAEAHFEKADLLAESGKIDAAIQELRQIHKLPFPDDEDVREQLFEVNTTIIELYFEAERFDEADALLRETMQRFAEEPRRLAALHTLMGHALRGRGQNEKALEHFNKAIELGRQALKDLDRR